MGTPGWMQQELTKEYVRQTRRIVEQLRETADRIERSAGEIPKSMTGGLPDHTLAASRVLTAIDTFHGNLSTSNLLHAAAEADRFARNPMED